MPLGGEESVIDHVRCVRDRSAFTKLWDDTHGYRTGEGVGCKRVTRTGCLLGEKARSPCHGWTASVSAKWDGIEEPTLLVSSKKRKAMQGPDLSFC